MRIISGKHKGIRIIAPKKLPVRPTTDMAKEALFNILNNDYYFNDIAVLDLFSGIGSISLEFASRGTKDITSVDTHRACSNFLSSTAEKYELDLNVLNTDVYRFLERQNREYDVVFADPPYSFEQEKFDKIVSLIFERNLLSNDGILIIEHGNKTDLSHLQNFVRERKYGGNKFSFFQQ